MTSQRRGLGGWLRLLVGSCSFLAGGFAAVAILAGHLGGASWAFERLADLRPELTGVALVALVGLAVARWWRSATALAVVAVVGAWTVAPLWLQPPAPADPASSQLRIASLNLSYRADVDAFAAHLRDTRPADLVVVVESSRRVDERFARGDTGYEVVYPQPGQRTDNTTVLARVPVTVESGVVLDPDPDRGPRAVDLTVEIGGEAVSVLGAHTRSPRGFSSTAQRNRELARIAEWVEAQDGPVVVIGDLNVTRWAPSFGIVTDEVGLVDSGLGYGRQPTWEMPGLPLAFPIDHLLHSPSLTTTSRRTGPSFGSDHAMLLATLALADR